MLQAIREKTTGWIAYTIIGLISIPFALWGVNSYLGGGEQAPAAIVNGEEISSQHLDFAYGRYRERLASVFGGSIPAALGDEDTLKEQVLTQIIEEQVLLSHIQDAGFRVGDTKLFENINSMSVFHQDGRFSAEQYRAQLASQGLLPIQFEEDLRRSQEMQQLSQAIRSSAFILPSQIDLYNQLNNQQRKLRTVSIEFNTDSVEVSEEQIDEYYNTKPALFMNPAMVKVDYIELNIDNVKNAITVSEDELLDRYEQAQEQLTTAEYRTASHILLNVPADADEEQQQQIQQQIADVKSRIDAGEDFAELAREFSQDPGSAAEGGDLGEVEKGMMVKPFESALFAMAVDEVSDPVKTQFGWHLIKLHEISGGDTQSFEQARVQIEQEIVTELAENQIYDLAENLSNISYEQPDSLLPASEQLELKIQTTDWFTQSSGEGLAEEAKVRTAAFSDDVLNLKRNSEVIELGDNRVVVIHLNEHKPAQRQPLSDLRDQIRRDIKLVEAREQTQQRGTDLLNELNQGSVSLDSMAQTHDFTIKDAGYVGRQSDKVGRDILNAAFTMQSPKNDTPVFEGISEVTGNYSIIELSGIKIAETSDSEQEKQALESLNQSAANFDYQAMIKMLTEQADIIRTSVSELN